MKQQVVDNFISERTSDNYSLVVDHHIGYVRHVVNRMTLNHHDTDDIVQEVFIKAYQKIDTYNGSSAFSTWICRIAYNHTCDFMRKRGRASASELLDSHSITNTTPFSPLLEDENNRQVHAAIAELPEKQRMAISLVAIDEMEVDEAAEIMGCTRATLYWRVHKARKNLKNKLNHLL